MDHLKYYDLSFQVYEKLKEMILTEQFKPGDKIKQEKVAELLGVSRTPLHKAFQMLENEYLVESIPRRGISVKRIDLSQFRDAFECREALESIAVRRVAKIGTKEDVAALRNLFEPFRNVKMLNDSRLYQQADRTFHSELLRMSGNQILQRLNMLGNIVVRTYQKGLVRPPEETLAEHFDIISAIEERDGEKAEMLMKKHLSKSRLMIENLI